MPAVSPAAAKSRHRFRCTHGAAEAATLQNKIKTWLAAASFIAHALDEAGYVHYGSSHGAVADFLRAVVGADAHGIEAAVKRFQLRLGLNLHSDPTGGAMVDVDRD